MLRRMGRGLVTRNSSPEAISRARPGQLQDGFSTMNGPSRARSTAPTPSAWPPPRTSSRSSRGVCRHHLGCPSNKAEGLRGCGSHGRPPLRGRSSARRSRCRAPDGQFPLGLDDGRLNFPRPRKDVETKDGAVAMHSRTSRQMYTGRRNYADCRFERPRDPGRGNGDFAGETPSRCSVTAATR